MENVQSYTYNPYTFDESEYSPQELQQLMTDICLGICKLEIPTYRFVTEEEFYGKERYERRQRSQRIGEAINRIKATRFVRPLSPRN